MSAPTVYEGALAPKEHAANGLFKGMKFWVGHRVPMRDTWIQGIQNNGGKVVPLEKNADYKIADHLRKDNPEPSYSYKFIEDSIKAGALQNFEDYLCKPQTAAKATAQKGTRTQFSAQDDLILKKWVIEHVRMGDSASGNTIYKDLAEKYPHHTSHSWRDRWVKKLQFLQKPEVSDEEPSPPPATRMAKSELRSSPSPAGTPRPSRPERIPAQSPATPGRASFTKDDDQILIQHIRECIHHNKALQGIKIFRDLANDFPQHSEQSWRGRWVKQLAPKLKDEVAAWESESVVDESRATRPNPSASRIVGQGHKSPKSPAVKASPRAQKPTNPGVDVSASLRPPNTASTQAIASAKETDADEGQDENQQQNSPTSTRTEAQAPPHDLTDASSDVDPSSISDVSMRSQFHRDYQAFREAVGLDFIPWLTIKGRIVELWHLWQAVASQKMDPDERDWQQIAEKLGFDWIQHETIHDELRECYEEYLAEFEEAWESFDANTEDDEDEDGPEDEDGDEEGRSPEVALPSSPPIMSSLKRTFDTHRSSDHAYPHSSPKRRRIDRDMEIPSTPDNLNGTSRLRRQSGVDISPAGARSTQHAVDEAEENESRDTIHELPTLPRGKKKVVEPETQDFRFDPETQHIILDTQEDMAVESQSNITPSQQLRQESDAVSPDLEEASPTPKAAIRATAPERLTAKRSIRNPFQEDSDTENTVPAATSLEEEPTPIKAAPTAKPKRRSLPKSFGRKPLPTASTSTSVPTREQAQDPFLERPQSTRRPTPPAETPEDVIDRFCSLGYPRPIVLQALRATTWRLGDAGQVMEILKRGEELPQRTRGVWTQRDDEALKLVSSTEPAKDEKEERKRARARKRLEEKHGSESMELRRKYLWEDV
ncbi:TRF2-interacting telomeric protein/Rap1 C terminal domain-containing protein [Hypomontagnella submonticulosa]|nr:TRF2-interacting telomeric protein/Rap1 C terminal domain-containing protein [Hypomontagnella submonticulosa]